VTALPAWQIWRPGSSHSARLRPIPPIRQPTNGGRFRLCWAPGRASGPGTTNASPRSAAATRRPTAASSAKKSN